MSCFSKQNVYLVFGTGITGVATLKFLKKNNLTFFITDDNEEKLKNLKIDGNIVDESDKLYDYSSSILKEKKITHLILSPSVHAQSNPHKVVIYARELGIEIIPDVDLFYEYLQNFNFLNKTDKKIVAITGTNGKSTTTVLTAFLFNKLGYSAIACGNIGINVLSVDVEKYDIFVVEMSSYNLFLLKYAKFTSGVLLNISEDHIEYHGTMENYASAKMKICEISKNKIVCIDDSYTNKLAGVNDENDITKISTISRLGEGFCWQENKFYFNNELVFNGDFENLPGKHNIENVLCSVACVVETLGTKDKEGIEKIFGFVKSFSNLPHRIQFIREKDGIIFINDSKGTNANSTQKALQAFKNDNIYLIAGGQRKTEGFLAIQNDLKNVKCVFLIGDAMDSFADELDLLGIQYYKCCDMRNAVQCAFEFARKALLFNEKDKAKSIVLLSPLCASWDQYLNFEHRGDDFIVNVNKL